MPSLLKFLLRHAAIGFGIAVVFVGLLFASDMGGIGLLIMNSDDGILAASLLTFFIGLTFASAQMGFAVMLEGRDNPDRRGGLKAFNVEQMRPCLIPVKIKKA
jgi:hypothetical protein